MPDRLPTARLRERLDVARQPAVLVALLVTMLWATGAFAVYTYLASFLARAAGLTGSLERRNSEIAATRSGKRLPDRPPYRSAGPSATSIARRA